MSDRTHTVQNHDERSMDSLPYERRFCQDQARVMALSTSTSIPVAKDAEEIKPYISSPSAQALVVSIEALVADLTCSILQKRIDAIRVVTMLGKQVPTHIMDILEKALFDASSFVRAIAAQAIGEVGGVAQMEVLLRKVNDPEPHVRASVIQALGAFGSNVPQASLENALEDPDEIVQEAAIWALAGLEERVPYLKLIALLKDENEFIRATAVEALGTIQYQLPQEPFIQILTAAAKDEKAFVRATALRILGQFGDEVSTAFFLQALNDEDGMVRAGVVRILGARREIVCVQTLIDTLHDEDELVQEEISTALGKLTPQCYRQLPITFLLATLTNQHVRVRCIGTWILGECKVVAALPALTHLIIHDTNKEVRITATSALEKYCEPEAQKGLTHAALYDADPEVRSAAISSLGARVLFPTLRYLIAHDSNQDVRVAAVCAMGKYYKQIGQEILISVACFDADTEVRSAAIMAFGEVREQDEYELLETLIQLTKKDEDLKVREAAEQVLGQRIQRYEIAYQPKRQTQPLDEDVLRHALVTDRGMLTNMLLISLLNFIEGKKGFMTANACNTSNERILVLNFYYQHDDELTLWDALLAPLKASIPIGDIASALGDTDAEVRLVATKTHEQLQERSWAETLILSCDFFQKEHDDKRVPTKMIVCLVGCDQVRADDRSIGQSLAEYLHPDHHSPFFRQIRDWVDIAFVRVQNCSEVKIWYSTSLSLVKAPVKMTPETSSNRMPVHQQRVQRKCHLMPLDVQ